KFRTCTLDIDADDDRWQWYRPCLLASIEQCTAPCNMRISKEDYRRDIRHLQIFLDGGKKRLLSEMRREMEAASSERQFEKAARLRDEIHLLESLNERGDLETHAQPEVFQVDPKKGLIGLRQVLKLKKTPRTIEGIDIAHLSGGETVASVVQFIDGLPFKPGYRRYKIRGVEGIDDYSMMREVLTRRFKRLAKSVDAERASDSNGGPETTSEKKNQNGKESWGITPDLVLIDGGKGHLGAALQVFLELGIDFVPLASLAKENEELFIPQMREPIILPRSSQGLFLVQRARDEAHRFAVTFHRERRSKKSVSSVLDLVPGIGPKRRRLLIRRFGSVKGIKEAPLDDVAAVPGMTLKLARSVKNYL
ncbi:MAG: UvrB/UvrC motif-containing protein, partial [Chloroflexi bacterium]|nr:UvrB/UvrC motif-containing protein [Chloroflexota bacterium]